MKRKGMTGQSPVPTQPKAPGSPGGHSDARAPSPPQDRMADLMNVPDPHYNPLLDDPMNSYRVLNNVKNGLDPEENRNTKVTLELLQQMEAEDMAQNDEDDFKPEDVLPPESEYPGDSEDDESVFNYLFPDGLSKKKKGGDKKLIGKNKFSEKIYNMKKDQKKKGGKSTK